MSAAVSTWASRALAASRAAASRARSSAMIARSASTSSRRLRLETARDGGLELQQGRVEPAQGVAGCIVPGRVVAGRIGRGAGGLAHGRGQVSSKPRRISSQFRWPRPGKSASGRSRPVRACGLSPCARTATACALTARGTMLETRRTRRACPHARLRPDIRPVPVPRPSPPRRPSHGWSPATRARSSRRFIPGSIRRFIEPAAAPDGRRAAGSSSSGARKVAPHLGKGEYAVTVKVAINGFGRIGRNVLRAIHESGRKDIEVVAINDLGRSRPTRICCASTACTAGSPTR